MVLHAIHLAESYSRIIVRSDDTDVEVLLIYYASKYMFGSSLVYMHAGHGMRERYVSINTICEKIGKYIIIINCICKAPFIAKSNPKVLQEA